MSKFTLFKKSISFLESSDRYYNVKLERKAAMDQAGSEFVSFYRSSGNIRTVLQKYIDTARSISKQRALDVLFAKLPSVGIYDVTESTFRDACWELDDASDAYDEIVEKYNAIEDELALEKAYREDRKDSRDRWVGGGFGVDGAIKGAATAGALNLASGLGHSLVNAIGNAGSELAAKSAKDRLYSSDDTCNTLRIGVRGVVFDTFTAYMNMVNDHLGTVYYSDNEFNEDRAEALFANAKKLPEKRKELLLESLQLCPYAPDALIYIFENYPEERQTICKMAAFYKMDISSCYENVLSARYAKADKSAEQALLDARADILADMKAYTIKESKTLLELDERYMQLAYERHYKTALPEQRQTALERITALDTTAALKKSFVKKHQLWELSQTLGVTWSDEESLEIIHREYQLLQADKAPEEKLRSVLQALLTTLKLSGKGTSARREKLFGLLVGNEKLEEQASKECFAGKEALLEELFKYWTKREQSLGSAGTVYISYRKGDANKLAKAQKIAQLQPGEYIVMLYHATVQSDHQYEKGIVLTDKRLIAKGVASIDVPLSASITVKTGGFFSADLVVRAAARPYEINLQSNINKEAFAECLQQSVEALAEMQDAFWLLDTERGEQAKILLSQAVRDNEFLVNCLSLKPWAERTIEAGEEAIRTQKQRKLDRIMDTVRKNDPASIAGAWCQVEDSGLDAEMIADAKKILFRFLLEIVQRADSLQRLEQVEAARQNLLERAADKMAELKVAMEGRHDEAARLGEITRQEKVTKDIMAQCTLTDLSSIVNTWSRFLACDCQPSYYEAYLQKLEGAILQLLEAAATIPEVAGIRDALAAGGRERYEKPIRIAEEKLRALDIANRTYRGVLFDSVEDIAFAQEEEKRLDILMRMVAKDDAASIDEAIRQISESPSKVKAVYLQELNGYKAALGEQLRTYRGTVYESQAAAEQAKQIYIAVRDIMDQTDLSSEESVADAHSRIRAMNHPITAEALKLLQENLDRIDREKRTVDGILLATREEAELGRREFARIQNKLAVLDENDEACLLSTRETIAACATAVKMQYLQLLDEKLQAYDVRIRSFNGVIYNTRELAALHREEAEAVNRIMATVWADNEPSMLAGREALGRLTTNEKDAPLAAIESWLRDYDIQIRTVEGVLYNTREEAQLIRSEMQRAKELLQSVSPDDEPSILNAQKEILKLTTFVKDAPYEELNRMWQEYDQRVRTYQDILFATRKQAQVARQEHEEFLRQFGTLDLSQRSSLTVLSNFVEDRIPAELVPQTTALIEDVRNVLNTVDYILRQDAAIDIVNQKKESAELHKYIESVLPAMTHYRMNTDYMLQLKAKHFASLNAAKKLFSFIKSKL